jgi:hypothetical protein
MKKATGLLLLSAFCLLAADFWQKPYTEWSDKDITKLMTNSPWAKATGIEISFGGGPQGLGAGPGPGGGGGGGRGGGPQGQAGGFGGGGPSVEVTAHWQSALPVREAEVRRKYGAGADKSEEAKKVLSEQPETYQIVLSGQAFAFPMGPPDSLKASLSEASFLSSARTGAIKPTQVDVNRGPREVDVLFVFPRSMPFTLEDKEVEFATTLGKSKLQYKFKLKDMVVNGKLEM